MSITQEEIQRINELYRKSKTPEGLTEDERAEQKILRQKYIQSVRANFESQLRGYKYEPPKDDK